jgi:hypothetical protein
MSPNSAAPWKSTRSEPNPLALAGGRGMARFTIGVTRDGHGKHLALTGNGYAQPRALCGYSVVPDPDGEASMSEWDARCCPQCAGIASALTRNQG